MKQNFLLFVLFGLANLANAQELDIPIRHNSYDLFERWDIQSNGSTFSTVRPFSRAKVVELLDSSDRALSGTEEFQKNYLLIDNREYLDDDSLAKSEKPVLGLFYAYRNDFFSHREENFSVHINPVFELKSGLDNTNDKILYRNGRGIEISGTIDDKVAFYTRATTNQIEYPVYVKEVADSTGVIPYEGFWKEYNETTTDFFRAFGYVDFGLTRHISAQVGFGRHFIGDGQRSMILSDFGNSYPYLRIDTEIWRFRYTNLFAELVADVFTFPGGTLGNSDYPKKYLAFHHLEFSVTDNFSIGVFESIVIGRPDSVGGAGLEYKYLNPVIFYRAVEQHDGSDYNALVGMNFKWDLWNSARFYGQFTLDELVIGNIIDRNGWWSNKYAYQLGMKLIDIGISDLDVQLEFNSSRPFTYAHDDLYTSYTHYLQPLAHPLGSNFAEGLVKIDYRPFPRWHFMATALGARYGTDEGMEFSVGKNILRSQNLFENEFGNKIGQGVTTDLMIGSFLASYQLRHNFFLDATVMYRDESSAISSESSTILTFGFRWNMPYRNYLF